LLAIGLPRLFASIEQGRHLDNSILVLGYVIMRVAMVFQWLRAARQDPARRRACFTYAIAISIAQIGWVVQIFFDFSIGASIAIAGILILIELAGPVIAESKDGGTPWHAHHIAERHCLFAVIALGEGVVGTVATLSAVVEEQGWTMDAALVCIAGTGLTFGMWWVYYMLPSAQILHAHRERSFVWGYSQMVIVTAIVATGAGCMSAPISSRTSRISVRWRRCSPLRSRSASFWDWSTLYWYLVRTFDFLHVWLLSATTAMRSLRWPFLLRLQASTWRSAL